MAMPMRDPEFLSMSTLSVVLIAPTAARRQRLAAVLAGPQANVARQFAYYPNLDELSRVIDECDVVMVELDEDSERALDLVEAICAKNSSVTVMVCSSSDNSDLLVRCMRVGAREFLTEPIAQSLLAEALVRASSRRQENYRQKQTTGKLLVFCGTKGGTGVTTLATNFSVALTRESGAKVVLVDINLQLGDAALELGLTPRFSVPDALKNTNRLDAEFVLTLLTKHSSGLSVLAAPDEYGTFPSLSDGGGKLVRILRGQFDYVVVDAGSVLGDFHDTLFESADSIYLVSQVSIPALRNSHRLISKLSNSLVEPKLEIILNRFDSHRSEIDENSINKALTRPAQWKTPNDYTTVRRAQNTGVPLALGNSHLANVVIQMARAACGKSSVPGKKKKFGLFG
jgi:pilus assembly protein CpaE